MSDQRKLRTTPWPITVRKAIEEGRRDGYMMAMTDIEAAIYSGDITKVVRSALHPRDPDEQPQIPLEMRIALGA